MWPPGSPPLDPSKWYSRSDAIGLAASQGCGPWIGTQLSRFQKWTPKNVQKIGSGQFVFQTRRRLEEMRSQPQKISGTFRWKVASGKNMQEVGHEVWTPLQKSDFCFIVGLYRQKIKLITKKADCPGLCYRLYCMVILVISHASRLRIKWSHHPINFVYQNKYWIGNTCNGVRLTPHLPYITPDDWKVYLQ